MSDCTLCEGTLVERGPWSQQWPDAWRACKACLSTPATDEIREVAREWLGFDPWDGSNFLVTGWYSGDWRERRDVLPLYLDAGFDLGCRVLARRWRISAPAIVFREAPAIGGWLLVGYPQWSQLPQPPEQSAAFCAKPDFESWGAYPALATIPADAPPNLRAALALKLCLEAT